MRLFALVALSVFATGCMTYDVRPDSRVDVRTAYSEREIASGTLAVVVDRSTVVVDDGGVSVHVGPGEPVETYLAFFEDRLPQEFRTQTPLESVVVGEVDGEAVVLGGSPAQGTSVTVGGIRPDYVLFVRNLRVFRAGYQAGSGGMVPMAGPSGAMMPIGGGSKQMAVRNDADVVLWDNAAGEEISSGRIESHNEYMLIRRSVFEGAVGEFVEQVVYRTPLAKREG